MVKSGVISKVTVLIALIRGPITPLITTQNDAQVGHKPYTLIESLSIPLKGPLKEASYNPTYNYPK